MKGPLGLIRGRHEIPQVKDNYIFDKIEDVKDTKAMYQIAFEKIKQYEYIDLYVTGLTVALISVINVCIDNNIELTLYHYDIESGEYYPQKVNTSGIPAWVDLNKLY